MMELFISAFITLFVVIDPPGCAPIFYGLTTGASTQQRRRMAIRAVIVATLILLAFAAVGEDFLRLLGISLEAFRIAGGIMLFFIAMDMVFEKRTQRREDRAQKIKETPEIEDVSIFPMAMPMIAGPGSIATVMLLMARAQGMEQSFVVLGALAANLVILAVAMLTIGPLMRLFGNQVEAVITRLLGVILAALAVQFVLDGLEGSIL
ncbi:multiple antibiotic resistance protein [Sphingobium xanthum]|jgi:multiple antibiotic resistance protein|uniref:MarC family protein n=1 Tax=Sphingobium xanthum TaxID=1387165 RepID=UPI001C8B127F|nr:MarC family protein [Sphingobium xanthum]